MNTYVYIYISDITRPRQRRETVENGKAPQKKSLIWIYIPMPNVYRKLSVDICWLCFVRASRTEMNKSSDAGRDHQLSSFRIVLDYVRLPKTPDQPSPNRPSVKTLSPVLSRQGQSSSKCVSAAGSWCSQHKEGNVSAMYLLQSTVIYCNLPMRGIIYWKRKIIK